MPDVRRREFITLLGGAAAAWPLAARAQQPSGMPRIGLLSVFAESEPEGQALIRELIQRLQELGWVNGRNVQIDFRFSDAAHRGGCHENSSHLRNGSRRSRCSGRGRCTSKGLSGKAGED